MRRRDFVTVIGGVAAVWSFAARAQQPVMPVVGILNGQSSKTYAHLAAALRQGLNDVGFVEGQNVVIEWRWADGHNERLPALAAELAERRVAVLVAGSAGRRRWRRRGHRGQAGHNDDTDCFHHR